jgi:hypothetical protein
MTTQTRARGLNMKHELIRGVTAILSRDTGYFGAKTMTNRVITGQLNKNRAIEYPTIEPRF